MPSHTRRQNCHKSSSGMIDRVPNKHFPNINGPQWQTEPVGKMPKQHCSKEKFAQVHTGGLNLGAHQLSQVHLSIPPRESGSWQSVLSRGETGRTPETNGFCSLQEHPPKSPSQGQLAMSSELLAATLARCHGQWLYSLKPRRARCRKSAAVPRWAQKLVIESGVLAAHCSKPIKRKGRWRGKFALFWSLATGEDGRLMAKD